MNMFAHAQDFHLMRSPDGVELDRPHSLNYLFLRIGWVEHGFHQTSLLCIHIFAIVFQLMGLGPNEVGQSLENSWS